MNDWALIDRREKSMTKDENGRQSDEPYSPPKPFPFLPIISSKHIAFVMNFAAGGKSIHVPRQIRLVFTLFVSFGGFSRARRRKELDSLISLILSRSRHKNDNSSRNKFTEWSCYMIYQTIIVPCLTKSVCSICMSYAMVIDGHDRGVIFCLLRVILHFLPSLMNIITSHGNPVWLDHHTLSLFWLCASNITLILSRTITYHNSISLMHIKRHLIELQ